MARRASLTLAAAALLAGCGHHVRSPDVPSRYFGQVAEDTAHTCFKDRPCHLVVTLGPHAEKVMRTSSSRFRNSVVGMRADGTELQGRLLPSCGVGFTGPTVEATATSCTRQDALRITTYNRTSHPVVVVISIITVL